ncbi:MAG: hypothetical protein WC705_03545 [Candidatus Paceibacterota bacterium]|jgi:hypothetical protein
MKKKLIYAIIPVVGAGFILAGVASAHGFFMGEVSAEEIASRQKTMFEHQANILGVGADVIKEGWAQGKTIFDIAKENGITEAQLQEKMKIQRQTQMTAHIQALVDQGVITQDQANKRLEFDKSNTGKKGMGMTGKSRGGFGMMGL